MRLKILIAIVAGAIFLSMPPLMEHLFADDDRYEGRYNGYDDDYHDEDGDHDDDYGHDDDGYKKGKRGTSHSVPVVNNQTYKDECASCHLAYPPGLLPAKGWEKIFTSADDHFGEDLFLDEETKDELLKYAMANSAESSGSKLSSKLLNSLKGKETMMITKIPYIKREHDEISSRTFKRESIGSLSNCAACHQKADEGDFEEDNIKIPRR